MSRFQIITLAIFIICIIAGVAAFALYRGGSQNAQFPAITVWGTFPADTFNAYVSKVNLTLASPVTVNYTQIKMADFSKSFTTAVARGQGPDAILVSADQLLPQEDKLTLIPYGALPERTFLDSYVSEADVYLNKGGILALPFTLDPLIMYWNKDAFAAAGLATYPKFWDEFAGLNGKLTEKDQNGNLRKTAIAMGEFSNITNAREFLGALFLQLKNPITIAGQKGVRSALKADSSTAGPVSALSFFTQAVNPSSASYSWNRGMPSDKTAFLSGVSATYFGFASELADIRAKNPNLNFDAAPLPQVKTGGMKATYGRMHGFSIARNSANANAAYQVLAILTEPKNLAVLSSMMYSPTVRTDVIAAGSSDPYITIFNQAALVSRTWLDADPAQSKALFNSMVSAVTSGQKSPSEALQDASDQYDVILEQATQ